MNKTITLILLALITVTTTAQTSMVDSLFTELKKWENKTGVTADTNLYNIYYGLGENFLNSNPDTALHFYNKSIVYAQKQPDELKEAKSISGKGWYFYLKSDYEQALDHYHQVLTIAEKNSKLPTKKEKAKKLQAAAFGDIGIIYKNQGDYSKALDYYFKALKINEEIGSKYGQAANLGNIGLVCVKQGDYSKALDYYFKAQKIDEEIGNKSGQAANLGNIGLVYKDQGDYSKALDYYFKSLQINEEIGNKNGQAVNLGNIGNVYKNQGDYSKALDYYFKASKLNEEIGNKSGKAFNLGNIGVVYKDQGASAFSEGNTSLSADMYSKALDYFFKALKIFEEIGNKRSQATNLGNIGRVYLNQKKYKEANTYINQAIQLGEEVGIPYHLQDFYYTQSEIYAQTGKYQEAMTAYKNHILYRDSVMSEENQKATVQKEMQFEFDKKEALQKAEQEKKDALAQQEQEKKDALAKQELAKQTLQRNGFIGGFVLMLVLAGVVFRSYRNKQKANEIITQQKQEVESQKLKVESTLKELESTHEQLEESHKEITDSINYAERIQRSFLASKDLLDHHLTSPLGGGAAGGGGGGGYFVFFQPKDVVSGDFYWASELNNGNFAFCCADSTGHGVPGAIMSILNISSLEKAIEKETEPHHILGKTRELIIERLKKDGSPEGGKDGMDCSLLVLNQDKTLLTFASANNPVFIVRKTSPILPLGEETGGVELKEFKPDKMPVGKHDKDQTPFTLQTVQLQKGDIIYTLTDGMPDQFGGEKGKKYMIKNLKNLFLSIAHLPMEEQHTKLENEFTNWKGENEQVDDICIIGVSI